MRTGNLIFKMLWPLKGQVNNRTRHIDVLKGIQGGPQYSHLRLAIANIPHCQTKGMLNSGYARCADRGGQVGNNGKCNGGDTGGFDLTLNQSNGPAADRSGRH